MTKHYKLDKMEIQRMANELVLKKIPIPVLSRTEEFPLFIQALEDHLIKLKAKRQLLLPNLHNHIKTISVFSDYGGESPGSMFNTYSFLFAGYDALHYCLTGMKHIREQNGLIEPYKEIAFKGLGYSPLARALDYWLRNADFIPGLLFTLVVHKNIASIITKDERESLKEISKTLSSYGYGDYKPQVAERLVRIINTIAYWCRVLSIKEQKIFWMTDDDAIMANELIAKNCGKYFNEILNEYAYKRYSFVGYATPFKKVNYKKFNLNDLLSIPDLVAGSVESILTKSERSKDVKIKEGANKILMWLCHPGFGLKKITMSIRKGKKGRIETAIVEFKLKKEPENVEYIPIWI